MKCVITESFYQVGNNSSVAHVICHNSSIMRTTVSSDFDYHRARFNQRCVYIKRHAGYIVSRTRETVVYGLWSLQTVFCCRIGASSTFLIRRSEAKERLF